MIRCSLKLKKFLYIQDKLKTSKLHTVDILRISVSLWPRTMAILTRRPTKKFLPRLLRKIYKRTILYISLPISHGTSSDNNLNQLYFHQHFSRFQIEAALRLVGLGRHIAQTFETVDLTLVSAVEPGCIKYSRETEIGSI